MTNGEWLNSVSLNEQTEILTNTYNFWSNMLVKRFWGMSYGQFIIVWLNCNKEQWYNEYIEKVYISYLTTKDEYSEHLEKENESLKLLLKKYL